MKPSGEAAFWGALLGRLGEVVADPFSHEVLRDRLAAHGAELTGQLPELLLRVPNPEVAVGDWLADKDLSHWLPQAWGGSAQQGWSFETASWNRARGAEPMGPGDILGAHVDGGLDALLVEGMPQALALEAAEAALIACALSLALQLLRRRSEWVHADARRQRELLAEALGSTGLAMAHGAALSLVLSLVLAMIPGGQLWLMGLSVGSLIQKLPSPPGDPFLLKPRAQ